MMRFCFKTIAVLHALTRSIVFPSSSQGIRRQFWRDEPAAKRVPVVAAKNVTIPNLSINLRISDP